MHILFSKFGEQTDRCTAFSATFQKTVSYTSTEEDIAWSVSTIEVTEKRTNDWTKSKYPILLPIPTESGTPPGFRILHGNYVSLPLRSSFLFCKLMNLLTGRGNLQYPHRSSTAKSPHRVPGRESNRGRVRRAIHVVTSHPSSVIVLIDNSMRWGFIGWGK
jgi:hypothetical protein